ncbi:uncharacterized protein M6B38_171145 [Iris pallida]|uniref:Uncharacterized protein n=1 Tax=Iris pallida TaxID=29817 RepID=A0AAX6EUH9_IRIPA|nr:uncharacterized protein M6B38_171145 [Iris pallida]
MIWISLVELSVDDPPTGKLTGKIASGLYRTFPTSAFELEEEEEHLDKKVEEESKKEESKVEDEGKKVAAA